MAGLIIALGLELTIRATPIPDMSRAQSRSQLVTSSSGEVLWGFLAEDQKWRLSTSETIVDPLYLKILLAYEDKRFRDHRGVDLAALLRASIQAIRHGGSVSGGSTLTMQVVRMLEPRPRTIDAKVDQIFKALRLERALGKQKHPRSISDARSVWRKYRRRARGDAALSWQGANAVIAVGSRAAHGLAAIARGAAARSPSRRGACGERSRSRGLVGARLNRGPRGSIGGAGAVGRWPALADQKCTAPGDAAAPRMRPSLSRR